MFLTPRSYLVFVLLGFPAQWEMRLFEKLGGPEWETTWANCVTMWRFRIGTIGTFVLFLIYALGVRLQPDASWLWAAEYCFYCYLIGSMLDVVDGTVARVSKQISLFGRWTDPATDKLIVMTAYAVEALQQGYGVAWQFVLPVLGILFYDWRVMRLRTYDAKVRTHRMAKVKQFVLFFAMGTFLYSHILGENVRMGEGDLKTYVLLTEIAYYALWGATLLCIVSGVMYMLQGRRNQKTVGLERGARSVP